MVSCPRCSSRVTPADLSVEPIEFGKRSARPIIDDSGQVVDWVPTYKRYDYDRRRAKPDRRQRVCTACIEELRTPKGGRPKYTKVPDAIAKMWRYIE